MKRTYYDVEVKIREEDDGTFTHKYLRNDKVTCTMEDDKVKLQFYWPSGVKMFSVEFSNVLYFKVTKYEE